MSSVVGVAWTVVQASNIGISREHLVLLSAVAAAVTAVMCELTLLDCCCAGLQRCRRRASRVGDGGDELLLLLLAPRTGQSYYHWLGREGSTGTKYHGTE